MPGPGESDHLHRGEQELIGELDADEMEEESFEDLISPVQNSDVEAAANSVRAMRSGQEQQQEEEQEEEEEQVAQDYDSVGFAGDIGGGAAGGGGGPGKRAFQPGDEDESSESDDAQPLPPDEPDQGPGISGGHTWSSLACAPTPPASSAPKPDGKSWVRPPDSDQE